MVVDHSPWDSIAVLSDIIPYPFGRTDCYIPVYYNNPFMVRLAPENVVKLSTYLFVMLVHVAGVFPFVYFLFIMCLCELL